MAARAGCSSWNAVSEDSARIEEDLNISNSSLMPPPTYPHPSQATPPSSSHRPSSGKRQFRAAPPSSDEPREGVSWQVVPDVVLVKVLGCLGDVDRCNASLACSRWRRVFRTPSLWRRRYFVFRGFDAVHRTDGYNAFMAQLGRHVQHISVELSRPNVNTASTIAKAFELFVTRLNKCPGVCLLSVRVLNADFLSGWHFFSHTRGTVLRALCNLLKKQSCLRSVDLSYCLMDRDDGTRLLDAVSYGTRLHPKEYLTHVDLRQFFSPRTRVVSFVRYGKVMGQFVSLSSTRMDLRSLNEAILERLVRASAMTLRHMELDFYADESVGNQAIRSQCWSAVRQLCPGMSVLVRIHGLCGFQKYASVLVREMPLSELRLTYLGVENLSDQSLLSGLRTLVVYLGDVFQRTLNRLQVQVRPDMDVSADVAVVGLVRRCVYLRDLSLNFAVQASTVVQILDVIHKHRAASDRGAGARKTRFHLNVRGMTPELDRSIRLMTSRGHSDVCAT